MLISCDFTWCIVILLNVPFTMQKIKVFPNGLQFHLTEATN